MTTRESERSTPRAPSWAGLGIAGVGVVQFLADGARGGAAVLVAALLCGAAVALARRAPVVAAGGVLLSVTAMTLLIGVPLFATFLALMLIAFALARYGARRQVMEGAAMILAAIAAVAVPELRHGRDGLFGLVYPTVYMGGAALLGWLTRQRADAAELRDRERRQAAQLAVVEERARLAREMHDVISHGVSRRLLPLRSRRSQVPVALPWRICTACWVCSSTPLRRTSMLWRRGCGLPA